MQNVCFSPVNRNLALMDDFLLLVVTGIPAALEETAALEADCSIGSRLRNLEADCSIGSRPQH